MDELIAGESALQLKERLLEREKDILVTQNDWLTQELEGKTEKLNGLLKERSTIVGELESQGATKEEEVRLASLTDPLRVYIQKSSSRLNFGIHQH